MSIQLYLAAIIKVHLLLEMYIWRADLQKNKIKKPKKNSLIDIPTWTAQKKNMKIKLVWDILSKIDSV